MPPVGKGARGILEVILHLGAHRTATTAFQLWLGANEVRLLARGIAVWAPSRTRAGLFAGLVRPPAQVTAEDRRAARRAALRIRQQIDRLAADGVTRLLVSEENMAGTILGNLARGAAYPEARARLDRFAEAFDGRVQALGLGIRALDDWWASCLAFAMARGRRPPPPEVLDRIARAGAGWRPLIGAAEGAFAPARITVWRAERLAGAPAGQLAALLDAPAPAGLLPPLPGRINAAQGRDGLRAILAGRGDFAVAAAIRPGAGRWMPFSPPQRQALRRGFEEDLAWLRSGAGAGVTHIDGAEARAARGDSGRRTIP